MYFFNDKFVINECIYCCRFIIQSQNVFACNILERAILLTTIGLCSGILCLTIFTDCE